MTQTMLHVDRARTRMPLECIVIAALVWTLSVAICLAAWFLTTNDSTPAVQGANSEQAPQSNTSTAKSRDPYEAESRVRPGLRY